MTREVVFKVVTDCIEATMLKEQDIFEVLPETILIGSQSELDSIALVMLIVAIEQRLFSEYSIKITIADDRAMSQTRSPFRTVESLTDYITNLINGGNDDSGV